MLVAVVDSLDPVPLPGVPPGHCHRDWRRYGVAVYWVVDHSCLELLDRLVRGDFIVPFPTRLSVQLSV